MSSLYLVSTYCACGDLFEQIISSSERGLPVSQNQEMVRAIMLQLIEGVAYLHNEKGIAHRDLKPENLYWDPAADNGKGKLLIGDFGLASEGRYASDFGNGTSFYASPDAVGYFRNIAAKEALTRSVQSKKGYKPRREEDDPRQYRYDAFASDIWSIGIILINLACERNPWQYASANDDAFLAYVGQPGTFLKFILPDLSDQCHDLLKDILRLEPESRLSLAEMHDSISRLQHFTVPCGAQSAMLRTAEPAAPRNSWIEMESSKDSCRSVSLSDKAGDSGSDDLLPTCWITGALSPSEAFYEDASPTGTFPSEYRFPPLSSAPAVLDSRPGSRQEALISPASVPCSLTLSASTEGSESVTTPAGEIADPMASAGPASAGMPAGKDGQLKLPGILFPVVKPDSQSRQSQSAAPVMALPLPPSRSPRPLLSPLFAPGDPALRSPIAFATNAPKTPSTPNFSFNPSPSIMTSPLRHAQQAFLEKHYMHYGPRRGSLPVAGWGERRESIASAGLASAGLAGLMRPAPHRRGSRPVIH